MEEKILNENKEREMELKDLIKILIRRRKLFVRAFIIFFCVATVVLFILPKIYISNVKILVEQDSGDIAIPSSLSAIIPLSGLGAAKKIETEMEIMQSRPIIDPIIRKYNKKDRGDYVQAKDYLKKWVKVENLKDTDIIEVTVKDKNPDVAKNIAEDITRLYMEQDTSSKARQAQIARKFVEEQIAGVKQNLAKVEMEIRRFKEKNKTVEITVEAEKRFELFSNIKELLVAKEAEVRATAAKLEELKRQLKKENPNFESSVTVSRNPIIQDLRADLVKLESNRFKIMQTYGEKHPERIALEQQIKSTKAKIAKEMELTVSSKTKAQNPIYQNLMTQFLEAQSDLYALEASAKALAALTAEQEDLILTLPAKEQQLGSLMRTKFAYEKAYAVLMAKHMEYKIKEASEISGTRVVEPPNLPKRHSEPKRSVGLVLIFIGGLFIGMLASIIADFTDKHIKGARETEEATGMKVLGLIPDCKKIDAETIFTPEETNPEITEIFRKIQFDIKFSQEHKKIIIFTSPTRGDGKTFVTMQLGKAFAAAQQKVLLVGCDIKNPGFYDDFDISEINGLCNYLTGEIEDLSKIICSTRFKNLSVLPCGSIPHNGVELMQGKKMGELLAKLRSEFDVIILNTAPIKKYSDTLALAEYADTAIICASFNNTNIEDLKKSGEKLKAAGLNIAGILLNRAPILSKNNDNARTGFFAKYAV